MRVIVLGAGVIGTTSAWYLAQSGHEVMVVDRQAEPALETSFANGGQISVSHSEPWANPTAPLTILKWFGREDAPLLFRPRADLARGRLWHDDASRGGAHEYLILGSSQAYERSTSRFTNTKITAKISTVPCTTG